MFHVGIAPESWVQIDPPAFPKKLSNRNLFGKPGGPIFPEASNDTGDYVQSY